MNWRNLSQVTHGQVASGCRGLRIASPLAREISKNQTGRRRLFRSEISRTLGNIARRVQPDVTLTQCGNRTLPPTLRGTQGNEKHLVFLAIDQSPESAFEIDLFSGGEIAFKHRKLEMESVILARLEDLSQALRVADVVGDNVVGAAHVPYPIGW